MNKELTQEEIDAFMNGLELPKKSTDEVKIEEPVQPNSSDEKGKSQVSDEEKSEDKDQGKDIEKENKS